MPDLTCLLKSAAASFQDAMCDSNVFFGCMLQARKPICQGRRGAVQGLLTRAPHGSDDAFLDSTYRHLNAFSTR